jgi:hypothetical protein
MFFSENIISQPLLTLPPPGAALLPAASYTSSCRGILNKRLRCQLTADSRWGRRDLHGWQPQLCSQCMTRCPPPPLYSWHYQWRIQEILRKAHLRSALFWDITQLIVVIPYYVSGQPIGPTFKVRPMGCPATPVRSYHYELRNIPEERRSYPIGDGSLKSRVCLC